MRSQMLTSAKYDEIDLLLDRHRASNVSRIPEIKVVSKGKGESRRRQACSLHT